jgi:hypothetical protein
MILGILASAGGAAAGSYESIATVTASGSSSTLSLTSIPSTYTHLQLRMMLRGTYAGSTIYGYLRLNATASVYSVHELYGDGSTVTATSPGSPGTYTGIIPSGNNWIVSNTATANVYTVGIVDVLDYANTSKLKTTRWFGGYDLNGSGETWISSGLFNSTNAITSIDFTIGANNIAAGSTFALYGIKAA